MMHLICENSNQIHAVLYLPDEEQLIVQFKSGSSFYVYKGVTLDIFEEFKVAESHGSYLARNIKGRYIFEKGLSVSQHNEWKKVFWTKTEQSIVVEEEK